MKRPRGLKAVLWGRECDRLGVRLKCHWCPRLLTFAEATADHDPPLAEDGSPRRAVLVCAECNQRRGRETDRRLKARRRKPRKRGRKK